MHLLLTNNIKLINMHTLPDNSVYRVKTEELNRKTIKSSTVHKYLFESERICTLGLYYHFKHKVPIVIHGPAS
jgi:hypothetical protein